MSPFQGVTACYPLLPEAFDVGDDGPNLLVGDRYLRRHEWCEPLDHFIRRAPDGLGKVGIVGHQCGAVVKSARATKKTLPGRPERGEPICRVADQAPVPFGDSVPRRYQCRVEYASCGRRNGSWGWLAATRAASPSPHRSEQGQRPTERQKRSRNCLSFRVVSYSTISTAMRMMGRL